MVNIGNKSNSRKGTGKRVFQFEKESSLLPQTEAIVKREILTFIREPNQVIHLLLLLFLILSYYQSEGMFTGTR